MTRKTRKTRKPGRKPRTRRVKKNTQSIMRTLRPSGFPRQKSVILPYVAPVVLTPTLGAFSSYQFRANSIFDPDLTGGGYQPQGRDQWAAFYGQYVVTKLEVDLSFCRNDNATPVNVVCGAVLTDDTALPPGPSWLSMVLDGKSTYGQLTPTASTKLKHKVTYDAKSFFNITDIKDNQERLGAVVGSNPPVDGAPILTVWSQAFNYGAIPAIGDIHVLMKLKYHVTFSSPNDLVNS